MERVRPIMLDSLDEKAKSFFMILRRKRGVETPVVSVAVGQALMENNMDSECFSKDGICQTHALNRQTGNP